MKTCPTFDYQFYFQEPVSPGPQFLSSTPILGLKPLSQVWACAHIGVPSSWLGIACPIAGVPRRGALAVTPAANGSRSPLPDLVPVLNSAENHPRPPAEPRWVAGSGPGVGWAPGEGWHHPRCFLPPCRVSQRQSSRRTLAGPQGPDPLHAPGGRSGAEGGPGVGAEGFTA